jgi:hypothetical protein
MEINDLLDMSLQELIALLSKGGNGTMKIQVASLGKANGKNGRLGPSKARMQNVRENEGKDDDDSGCEGWPMSQDDTNHIGGSYS